jgi:hypothetical protein
MRTSSVAADERRKERTSMAELLRRAARQYELHEIHEGTLRLDLGLRAECDRYDEAVDAAFAYLQEHDPQREGRVAALEIVQVDGGTRRTVWAYSATTGTARAQDLRGRWGFDVTRPWTGPPSAG